MMSLSINENIYFLIALIYFFIYLSEFDLIYGDFVAGFWDMRHTFEDRQTVRWSFVALRTAEAALIGLHPCFKVILHRWRATASSVGPVGVE